MKPSEMGARAWLWHRCLHCSEPTTFFNESRRRFCSADCREAHNTVRAAA